MVLLVGNFRAWKQNITHRYPCFFHMCRLGVFGLSNIISPSKKDDASSLLRNTLVTCKKDLMLEIVTHFLYFLPNDVGYKFSIGCLHGQYPWDVLHNELFGLESAYETKLIHE